MSDNAKKSNKILLTVLLVLAVLVAATFFALGDVLDSFFMDTSDAVEIGQQAGTQQSTQAETPQNPQDDGGDKAEETPKGNISAQTNTQAGTTTTGTATTSGNKRKPDFTTTDEDGKVWGVDSEFEIFRIQYDNASGETTVEGADGAQVIAPGTENTYTFKLKNTGETNMWYYFDVDAYITPSDVEIPVQSRISRYDGRWIAGDEDTYVDIETLGQAEDDDGLGRGKYTYYTLEWMWPFESGDDGYDTYLGNLAVDEAITMTIKLKTTAVSYADGADMGITLPNTGDVSNVNMYVIFMAAALCIIIVLLLLKRREKEEDN